MSDHSESLIMLSRIIAAGQSVLEMMDKSITGPEFSKEDLATMKAVAEALNRAVGEWYNSLYRPATPTIKTVELDVPWISQWDPTADRSSSDCGATCLAMISLYHSDKGKTPNWFTDIMGVGNKYANAADLFKGLRSIGLHGTVYGSYSRASTGELLPDVIEGAIDNHNLIVALVDYETLVPEAKFNGLHWIVIAGYTSDGLYLICDPLPRLKIDGRRWLSKNIVLDALAATGKKKAQINHGLVIEQRRINQ